MEDAPLAVPRQRLKVLARAAEARDLFEIFARAKVSLENVDLVEAAEVVVLDVEAVLAVELHVDRVGVGHLNVPHASLAPVVPRVDVAFVADRDRPFEFAFAADFATASAFLDVPAKRILPQKTHQIRPLFARQRRGARSRAEPVEAALVDLCRTRASTGAELEAGGDELQYRKTGE